MTEYVTIQKVDTIPRIPLEGLLDITYRCNNNCRHCWISIPSDSLKKKQELGFDEIRCIVDDARKMGCQRWSISGGEPMIRDDFIEIFDYITEKSVSYSVNTNGTLITPEIARLMKTKGSKMVALYGATAEVHDHITRTPGSFDAVMRGFAYLKEAGTGFIVQIVPMRDNYYQLKEMIRLAETLSRSWRIGAAWLYLSASGDPERNREILNQRLDPGTVVELDRPDPFPGSENEEADDPGQYFKRNADPIFAACISARRKFHIDPYGRMTFCGFIKDPALLYDLKQGAFQNCWEEFIPSLADRIRGGTDYRENCGSCDLKDDCLWCPVYGYLEHQNYATKIEYLCAVAEENRKFKENWRTNHRRFYQVAGITVQVDSDIPIIDTTFNPKFKSFEVNGPNEDNITIQHHFHLPDLKDQDLGEEVYRKAPWAIYKNRDSWLYLGIPPVPEENSIYRVAVFNRDYTKTRIYNDNIRKAAFQKGGLGTLTLFPTDQILLAQVLAGRQGCYVHSSGVILNGKGLIFVGRSGAGKSTIATLLKDRAEILCDDQIIVRKQPEGFRIHGTWSHGDVPEVSGRSAPLTAIMFLEKDTKNLLVPLVNRQIIIRKLLASLVKPFETADWWEKMLTLIEMLICKIPCYNLHFNKSDQVLDLLKDF